MSALRCEFQNIFTGIFEEINRNSTLHFNQRKINQLNLIIHNLLALYPFADPHPGEILYVPTRQNGSPWYMMEYSIEPIELTPTDESYQKIIEDKDRVFCYGLRPIAENFSPILIFMGTTYPTGQGKNVQYLTNAMPNHEIGEQLYLWGKERVLSWLNEINADQRKVISTGASLGGILASMFAMNTPRSFSEVYAFNPPGFLNLPTIDHPEFGEWFQPYNKHTKPQMNILSQKDDPISSIGYFVIDENINFLKTKLPNRDGIQLPLVGYYMAHIVIHVAYEDICIHRLDDIAFADSQYSTSRIISSTLTANVFRPVMHFFERNNSKKLADAIKNNPSGEETVEPLRNPALIHQPYDIGDRISSDYSFKLSSSYSSIDPTLYQGFYNIVNHSIAIIEQLERYIEAYSIFITENTTPIISSIFNTLSNSGSIDIESANNATQQWINDAERSLNEFFTHQITIDLEESVDLNQLKSLAANHIYNLVIHLLQQLGSRDCSMNSFNHYLKLYRDETLILAGDNDYLLGSLIPCMTVDEIQTVIHDNYVNSITLEIEFSNLEEIVIDLPFRSDMGGP